MHSSYGKSALINCTTFQMNLLQKILLCASNCQVGNISDFCNCTVEVAQAQTAIYSERFRLQLLAIMAEMGKLLSSCRLYDRCHSGAEQLPYIASQAVHCIQCTRATHLHGCTADMGMGKRRKCKPAMSHGRKLRARNAADACALHHPLVSRHPQSSAAFFFL